MEGLRIARGHPAPAVYVPSARSFSNALAPATQLAWHVQVRELFCLRHRDYTIEETKDWHDEPKCWIGVDRKTQRTIAIHCPNDDLDIPSLKSFIRYALRYRKRQKDGLYEVDFFAVVRRGTPETLNFSGQSIRLETEDSLLDDLVDFSDYFAHIVRRVETDTLPDSGLSIRDVYIASHFRREAEEEVQPDVERYILDWVSEYGERQLALLGEYGQGKSTAALMAAYRIILNPRPDRIPILIELRGKSPRNLTPEELISAWAYPYHIDPRGIMQLLMARQARVDFGGFRRDGARRGFGSKVGTLQNALEALLSEGKNSDHREAKPVPR